MTWDDAADAKRIAALAKSSSPKAIAELAAMSKLGAAATRKAAKAALEAIAPAAAAKLATVVRGAMPSREPAITKKLKALEAAKFPDVPELAASLADRGVPVLDYACALAGAIAKRILAHRVANGYLDLSGVRALPGVLAELPITSLELRGCGLTDIPDEVLAIAGLDKLVLAGNRIRRLGDDVVRLRSLRTLEIDDKSFASLDNLDRLVSLCELELHRTKITDLPASFAKLTKLAGLSITGAKGLTELPAVIPTMRSLRRLNLSGNGVTSVDPAIWNLRDLDYLALASTQLGDVPAAIGNLTEVRKISFNSAGITSLPAEIGNCKKLEELDLVFNHGLAELPAGFYELTSLRRLRVQYTSIKESTWPGIAKRLPKVHIYK